ncbi:UNVERIFIED_CONTAM: hypothetical protein RMT77_014675 [Armadillidium vulgare]
MSESESVEENTRHQITMSWNEESEYVTILKDQDEKCLKDSEENKLFLHPSPTKDTELVYGVSDIPPWYYTLFLAAQSYLLMVGSTLGVPFYLCPMMCMDDNDPSRIMITSSIIFVSGIVTILQSSLGVRLPIIQGGTFGFLLPTMAILSSSFPSCDTYNFSNMTLIEKEEVWKIRMREIQGAIAVSSLVQITIGLTGAVGFALRWITPLTVVPSVTLIGLSLFAPATEKSATHWGIAIFTAMLMVIFSMYLNNLFFPYFSKRKFSFKRIPIFKFFPILLATVISWLFCFILTMFEVLPKGSPARTDTELSLIYDSPWFYIPYPFQWGIPTVSVSGVIGMLSGVLASVAESIGDYYACARLSGTGPPPTHAVNRGVTVEGIGCLIAGVMGTGNGTTTYSDSIGAIRIIKVASLRVIQVAGVFMIAFSMVGKLGGLFVSIPNPVIGGASLIHFGIIVYIGLSNLHLVDLNSSRNLFILGVSLFNGLAIPQYIGRHPGIIQTGQPILDQTLTVLLSTSIFVGGFLGLVLDNTIPGTDEERGLTKWRIEKISEVENKSSSSFDLPFGMKFFNRTKWSSYIPISPTYKSQRKVSSSSQKSQELNNDILP